MEQLTMDLENRKSTSKKMTEDELIYPISINYGKKDWNVVSSLREFIANMLDTKANYAFKYVNGFAHIEDLGKGLTKKDFIFGESTKSDSDIGQFGEGTKMALIQLLREGRKAYIRTVGFTVTASKAYSDVYDSEVMLLKFEKNDRKVGTEVVVECKENEFDESINLFIDLNKNLSKVDQNIYMPAGSIFIVGLDTNKLPNTIFSYNIEDKTMSNRDRNIVAAQKLNENIVSILSKMKNQKAITEFLKPLESNPGKYEYQLPITAVYKESWLKVIDKLYTGKTVLSSDIKSDLHAMIMGFKVLRGIPHYMNALLRSLNVQLSSDVAKNYKGQSLFEESRMVYPISSDYCANWTTVDAIREMIANAIDTGTAVRVEHSEGKCRIYDSGDGIMKKHFIFGISEKAKSDIGQFGEGLKVSSLVLVRNKREVLIQTKGYNYKPAFERFDEFDSNLFTVYFEKNQRSKGTIITFDATQAEVEKAKALFTHFKDSKKSVIERESLNVFLDDPGSVYVNGLKTQTITSLFGYDIKDKAAVNSRDRNYVNTGLLNHEIIRFLRETNHVGVIEKYLTGYENRTIPHEYMLNFTPINLTPWEQVGKKIFKKACLYSHDDRKNFIAKQAGYKILRNMPSSVLTILRDVKIETADQVAKRYEDKGILFNDEIIYPITSDYCSNWTISDAIRELISNALDTESKVTTNQENNLITITDRGLGIAKNGFLFSSSQKDSTKIGAFGEGLKLAMLVLARNRRMPEINTQGNLYKASIKRDVEFNAEVLVIKIEPSKKKMGTEITFIGSAAELENAKAKFLKFNHSQMISPQIYNPGNSIYVNGVHISKVESLYSYDLKNEKDLLSRDRKNLNMSIVSKQVAELISKTDNPKIANMILSADLTGKVEETLNVLLSPSVKSVWKKEANALYPKSCLSSSMDFDYAAIDRGYNIINCLSALQCNLLQQLGFDFSHNIVTLNGDEEVVMKRTTPRSLTAEGKERYKKSVKIYKKLYGNERAEMIELVEEFNTKTVSGGTLGFYNQNNQKIYILKDLFDSTFYKIHHAIGVMIHEEVHHISGAHDRSREFENALTWELGRLAEIYVK